MSPFRDPKFYVVLVLVCLAGITGGVAIHVGIRLAITDARTGILLAYPAATIYGYVVASVFLGRYFSSRKSP